MRNCAILRGAAILAVIALSGCFIPTDYYTDYSRKNTADSPPENIVPGTTTREEVLRTLGEPDEVSADETELWYDAVKVKGILIIGNQGDYVIQHYLLVVRFKGNGVVESQQVFKLTSLGYVDVPYICEPHHSRDLWRSKAPQPATSP